MRCCTARRLFHYIIASQKGEAVNICALIDEMRDRGIISSEHRLIQILLCEAAQVFDAREIAVRLDIVSEEEIN